MNKEYEQGSSEWLEIRTKYVTATDACAIMGASPYKTRHQCWLEKFGFYSTPENGAMIKGKEMEPIIREMICNRFNDDFYPKVVFSPTHKFMMASLDGINDEGCVIEIKYANRDDHALARTNQVPQKYFWQLQHIMECCEVDFIWYVSYNTDVVYFKVYRDEEAISKMLVEENNFFKCMTDFIEPELTEKDFVKRTDEAWQIASTQYKQTKAQLIELNAKEQALRSELISLANGMLTAGNGLRLSLHKRRGAIDYSLMIEQEKINTDKYRKSGTEVWRISDAN